MQLPAVTLRFWVSAGGRSEIKTQAAQTATCSVSLVYITAAVMSGSYGRIAQKPLPSSVWVSAADGPEVWRSQWPTVSACFFSSCDLFTDTSREFGLVSTR